jgi:hypothetical protein
VSGKGNFIRRGPSGDLAPLFLKEGKGDEAGRTRANSIPDPARYPNRLTWFQRRGSCAHPVRGDGSPPRGPHPARVGASGTAISEGLKVGGQKKPGPRRRSLQDDALTAPQCAPPGKRNRANCRLRSLLNRLSKSSTGRYPLIAPGRGWWATWMSLLKRLKWGKMVLSSVFSGIFRESGAFAICLPSPPSRDPPHQRGAFRIGVVGQLSPDGTP